MQTNAIVAKEQATSASDMLPVAVLGVAIGLGVLGDLMLRAKPWGVSFPVCVVCLASAAMVVARRFDPKRSRMLAPVFASAVLFASGCAWRDSATLKTLDVLAAALVLALALWRAQGGSLVFISICLREVGRGVLQTLFGAPRVLFGSMECARRQGRIWRHVGAVGVGVLLALPFLMLFGGLLASADAVFEKWVLLVLDIDLPTLLSHTFLTGFFAWIAAGYLHGLLLQQPPQDPPRTDASAISLGNIEVGIVLGCLNCLFLAFVVVQFRHLFGGSEHVQVVPGLTYAAYARRGFFELVTVAALLLPLLLAADWLLRKEARKHLFRVLAGALVVMLSVIMASAMHRMRMYQLEYGLTELRLYTSAFMVWLALVFMWFSATVLRGRRERFLFGALAAAGVGIIALHAVNPDALIVRVNVTHAQKGRPFDVSYAASLSADAVPALLQGLPKLRAVDQRKIMVSLRERWLEDCYDWRNWSVSHAQARRLVGGYEAANSIQRE